ncbi:adenine phosphoribosyltransferase [Psychromonas sp. RZ22]|uniref:adenine phosphoribosyltransferase n=1 Tax=Psychromonas algarum TaxID=2555643 RepID=UPI0010680391|nr:adenine phosphoribosyltransferase [Psychromonas sp. RZ22]TEW56183.1 adenine phosphoribosyltransferase [Psychromonas sp. RZ22]
MSVEQLTLIKNSIKTIEDYPVPGITFRDITSLIENGAAFSTTIELFIERYKNQKIDKIVGTEARGFIFGAPLAAALGAGFVPVRKPNKLPRETIQESYDLEYGSDILQIHKDAIKAGENVLLMDDLIATGGTAEASVKLIESLGGKVIEAAFVISLPDLQGVDKLSAMSIPVFSLIEFAGE